MEERLQKILARAGIASRRKCEELILRGRIKVDGRVITKLGFKADPAVATITFDNKPVRREKYVYILLNKPAGYVTTLNDPQDRPIVTDLLPEITERVFPVGRLDLETEGALILTNDGRLGQHIIHPRYEVNKTYVAVVRGRPAPEQLDRLRKGIRLEEGYTTWPARIATIASSPAETRLEIIIHEGKKRQVRRMLAAIGHPVKQLTRTAYGNLKLGRLARGQWRFLNKNDIKKIFSGKIPFTFRKIPD